MVTIDVKLVLFFFCVLSAVLSSGSGAPKESKEPEKHEFEVQKLRVKDANGGKDWILELKGDIITSQYREGVSSVLNHANCFTNCKHYLRKPQHKQAES